MSARRIAFLTRALDVGGAQYQMIELARGLKRRGWQVTVITFYDGGVLAPLLADAGIEHVSLGKRGRWDVARFGLRLVRTLRVLHPDVVHGYMDMSNILVACARPCLRGAAIVWGVAASHSHVETYPLLARLEFRLGAWLSRFADLIISNSESGRLRHVAAGYPAERMRVVPNGIDFERFKPDPAARAALRAEWGIAPDAKLLGVVGRLDPMKDYPNFLRAAAQVAAADPRARFVCVGDGPADYRAGLHALASELGLDARLTWVGQHPAIERVYNALDFLVSSSLSEGLPNVIVEAMATGVPCVVTDVGDSKRVVGALGWVCPPQDSAALAEAMLRALAAPPCDADALRRKTGVDYSAQALVATTEAELLRLVADTRSASAVA